MVPSLDLNLSTRPFRNNTVPWAALLLGVLLAGLLSYWNVSTLVENGGKVSHLREEMATYDARMADLERRDIRARQGVNSHDIPGLKVQTEKANDVIQLKSFSWTRLFNQLETVIPYDVRMLSVRPLFRVGQRANRDRMELEDEGVTVTVEGVARNRNDEWKFQAELFADPHFDRIEPEYDMPADNGEILFKLRFRYYPYTEEDRRAMAEAEEEAKTTADEPEAVEEEPAPGDTTGEVENAVRAADTPPGTEEASR